MMSLSKLGRYFFFICNFVFLLKLIWSKLQFFISTNVLPWNIYLKIVLFSVYYLLSPKSTVDVIDHRKKLYYKYWNFSWGWNSIDINLLTLAVAIKTLLKLKIDSWKKLWVAKMRGQKIREKLLSSEWPDFVKGALLGN